MQRPAIELVCLLCLLCGFTMVGAVQGAAVTGAPVSTAPPVTATPPTTDPTGAPLPGTALPLPGTAPPLPGTAPSTVPTQPVAPAPATAPAQSVPPAPVPVHLPASAPPLPVPGGVMPVASLPVNLDDPDDPALVDQTQWLLLSESVEQAGRDRETLRGYGLQLRGRTLYPVLQMVVSRFVLTPASREDPPALLARLRREQPDLTLEFNRLYVPLQAPELGERLKAVRSSPERYGQVLVGLDERCREATASVTVAMLDGQVNTALPEFGGVQLSSVDVTRQGPAPTHHATAIAALLTGSGEQSLLPGAGLLAITVFALNDQGQLLTRTEWLLAGLEQLLTAQPRPVVANLSLGGPDSLLLTRAFNRVAGDILLVAAAGNQGSGRQPTYPARLPAVVAVTAVGPDARLYAQANRGDALELAAPGVDIRSINAQGQPTYVTGTSFAAPWVTAAAGRLAAVLPDQSGAVWRSRLQAMTLDLGPAGRDSQFGFGLLDLAALCKE